MNFLRHTDRVSGKNLQNDGELLSFLGLQGAASSYNSVNEALKDEGDPIEDNYSQMFSSVLGVGQDIMNDLVTTLTIVTDNLDPDHNPNGEAGAIAFVDSLASNTSTFNTEILEQIDFDNNNLSEALRTLKRFGLGVSIMGMDKDTFTIQNEKLNFTINVNVVLDAEKFSDALTDKYTMGAKAVALAGGNMSIEPGDS